MQGTSVLIDTPNDIIRVEEAINRDGIATIASPVKRLTTDGLLSVLAHVKNSKTIRNLYLNVGTVSDDLIARISDSLRRHPCITDVVLTFGDRMLSPTHVADIFSACDNSTVLLLHLGERNGTWKWDNSAKRTCIPFGQIKVQYTHFFFLVVYRFYVHALCAGLRCC